MDYLDIADRAWPVLGPLMRWHAALYRAKRAGKNQTVRAS